MGRLKVKGKAGAAKNFTTRSAAIKKLQCSLADFRRLCILKGIFPREPNNRKKANKGSSAPTSFYYTKDIAYLAHEPILKKLRDHKAFAKKLSRALGRGEWSSAKSLEDNKPFYRLDHIIKERYPTFIDAVRDIDDALCMIFLFSSLPSNSRLPPEIIENCARLSAEWQLYVMHTRALRKVFLSIKGVYYQAEIQDQPVTWLVPYLFTQNIPTDVDVRVMLTFLELYQTLLSFVFFKLYTDAELVYPPPLDMKKDEGGAGLNAFRLQDISLPPLVPPTKTISVDDHKISGKDVQQAIKAINASIETDPTDIEMSLLEPLEPRLSEIEEDFVVHPSLSDNSASLALPTLQLLAALPHTSSASLFSPYTFFLSRETSRSIFEFAIRCFGGRVGWPASSGMGSPFDESDPTVTHVIIDRPIVEVKETLSQCGLRTRRKYVQPQWIIDCINAGKILLEELYAQGKALPPHLSPFGEYEGAYVPGDMIANDISDEGEGGEMSEEDSGEKQDETLEASIAVAAQDAAALRVAELAAEASGVDYGTFEERVKQHGKKLSKNFAGDRDEVAEKDMNKMMMSNRQKKLYEKMKYSQKKKEAERMKLENRKRALEKQGKRKGPAS